MYKIGYVDEDSGQRNSFYHYLKNDFEVILFEITEETELESLAEEILNSFIDLLVLDFRLDENGLIDFNADKIVEKLLEVNKHYPLVILTSHEVDALDHIPNANLVNGKDEMLGHKLDIFKQKLSKIAHDYKVTIETKQQELEELERKREIEELLPNEEDRYVELNSYLDQTVSAEGHISRSFYSEGTNKRLDELITKTEELLKKISDS